MTTLAIHDLAINEVLDRKAMSEVLGRGRVAYEYTGSSSISTSAWQYTGQYFKNFVGNTYLNGHGWVSKYRTGVFWKEGSLEHGWKSCLKKANPVYR